MRIQHNIMAMGAYRNYTNNVNAMKKNLEKLSSGYKINRAGDDAAGLAISEKMRAQITGLETAQKNAKDGISLVQTAEGALTEVHDMLNRMVTLATQSANGTYDNDVDRFQLQKEMNQLKEEINRIADSSNFNGIKLLDGSLSGMDPDGAISEITTNAYRGQGAADAFKATYITNRPEAATAQQNAEFVVSLDDMKFAAGTTGKHKVELTVGDATITFESADETAQTSTALVDGLITKGKALDAADTTNNTLAAGDGAYVKIDGNIYKMEKVAGNNSSANVVGIKFTQVNDMANGASPVDPGKYAVSVKMTPATGGTATGTVNRQPQNTKWGLAVGTTHQAQVDVTIDFSKLKDGDRLIAGDKTYTFKFGAGSGTTAAAGETLIDLSSILKTPEDLADKDKQAEAMTKMAELMGASNSTTWSIGTASASNGIGTLTFQSLSSYVDDVSSIGGSTATGAPTCNMTTESSIMKQFSSAGSKNPASTTITFDVTKLKAGDTISVDGKLFEFTDGTRTDNKDAIAVDLSGFGIADGILASQSADVLNALSTQITGNVLDSVNASKYTVTVNDNKLTLTSKDDTNTTTVFEDRVAASVSTSGGKGLMLQIGDTAESFNQLNVKISDCHVKAIGIADISIADQENAAKAVDAIKSAINYVSDVRGTLGATQNRLDHTINNLSVMTENIQDAESTIRDTDVAAEMMEYTKNNILIQSAQAMLAQANQVPQGVLQLLQ